MTVFSPRSATTSPSHGVVSLDGSTSRRFNGGLTLGASELWNQAGTFLRSVITARLLSPQDFGIVAILSLTFAFLQMVSNLAIETLLVQAKEGDVVEFQSTAHFIQACRGIALAVILFALARPVANLLGVADAHEAFALVAVVPLIRGLAHSDVFRLQRGGQFRRYVQMNVWTTAITTAATLPLAWLLRNYTVIVGMLVTQALIGTAISHAFAERPYRWSLNAVHRKAIFTFGWPLLVNGVLMYLIFQGDQLAIALARRTFPKTGYSLSDLAVYSLAFSVVQMPTMLVANVCSALFLPVMSRSLAIGGAFKKEYVACAVMTSLAAAVTSGPLILAGGWLIEVIYGARYSSASWVIVWLVIMQSLRVIRVTPTVGAIALGDTKTPMWSNAFRLPAFGLVLVSAASGQSMAWIAFCGVVGETIALGTSLWALRRLHGLSPSLSMQPLPLVITGLVASTAIHSIGPARIGRLAPAAFAITFAVGITVAMLAAYPRLRRDLQSLVAS